VITTRFLGSFWRCGAATLGAAVAETKKTRLAAVLLLAALLGARRGSKGEARREGECSACMMAENAMQ